MLFNANAKGGLNRALEMLSQKDDQILSLGRRIRRYHHAAGTVVERVTEDKAARAATARDPESTLSNLLLAFKGDKLLARMAERGIRSMQRM